MQLKTHDHTEQRTPRTETEQRVSPPTIPIEEVVDFVRRDSQIEPRRYLEEVRVPYGGE